MWQWMAHDSGGQLLVYVAMAFLSISMDCWVRGWGKLSEVHQLGQTSDSIKSLSQKQTEVMRFQWERVVWVTAGDPTDHNLKHEQ